MKAKNKQQYIDSWNSHIQQLQSLANARYWNHPEDYGHWKKLRAELKTLVVEAADETYPKQVTP